MPALNCISDVFTEYEANWSTECDKLQGGKRALKFPVILEEEQYGSRMFLERWTWGTKERKMNSRSVCNVMYSAFIPQMGLAAFRGPILFPLYRVFRETNCCINIRVN